MALIQSSANAGFPDTNGAELAVRDWLDTQIHVLAYWREMLLASGDESGLVEVLDDHAAFLRGAAARSEGKRLRQQ
ncbi:MAG: hypothetical protein QUV02_14500 [Maricaulis sp.]|uniref:hypothetical protein n=1 Tax=Maricaulis sp. TaxID=1486257 RepID=UPI0026155A5C|nr:hypothetical protein [Maricaulis sp.]MDM7985648.1 hypothetical protein [Maricaulis sp.]